MGRASHKSKPNHKPKPVDRDDDISEPYSDELNVSSPEVLEMGDDGEVVQNSDWNEKERSEKRDAEAAHGSDEDEDEGDNIADDPEANEEEPEWESEEDESEEEEDGEDAAKRKLSTVSFGVLSKAQESLGTQGSKKRKREINDESEIKLDALRKRLKELQHERQLKQRSKPSKEKESKREKSRLPETKKNFAEPDFDGSDDDEEKTGRSSKHAPTEMTSRKTVGRKRNAISVPKVNARDPRFDTVTGTLDRDKVRKNYKFLDDYVDHEIKDLKHKLKDQKTPTAGSKKKKKKGTPKLSAEEVDELKRELMQKESRRQSQNARDRQQDVIKEHKKKEKELVRQGKTPYFLKNSDVKKEVIVKQFEGLSEGKREKAMERRRKKMASKERKGMPFARRVQE